MALFSLDKNKVYGLDLKQTDSVVLSACETHLGGDELVGLTRAFFFAGTLTVIASLWRVDDEATAILMERFYRHLRVGLGKAAALRQAQLDMLVDYPNPYYCTTGSALCYRGMGGEGGFLTLQRNGC